jgi:hypothetical protein
VAREAVNILACAEVPGSSFSDPAGMKTIPSFSMNRGTRPPQFLQKVLVNLSASGGL